MAVLSPKGEGKLSAERRRLHICRVIEPSRRARNSRARAREMTAELAQNAKQGKIKIAKSVDKLRETVSSLRC